MKTRLIYVIVLVTFFGLSNQSCNKDKTDPVEINSGIIILPESPTATNEVKIIEEICSYEILSPIIINGNNITYSRHFNSSMKLPCEFKLDTVSLGQLQEGHYTINYFLIDISFMTSDSIVGTDKIYFYVSK